MWIWISLSAVLILLIIFIVWGNVTLKFKKFEIKSERIPKAFSGFTIANVSDFHNSGYWAKNQRLTARLKEINPDIIVITGDLIDARRPKVQRAIDFVRELIKIAPTYFVSGNHESRINKDSYNELINGIAKSGAIVLDDASCVLEKDGESITLAGMKDPQFSKSESGAIKVSSEKISSLYGKDDFRILLSHRPDFIIACAQAKVDLVLCGHTHGGQFKLPLIGGIIAPNQGLFPKYDTGLFEQDETRMIISSGVGNSWFPFRFNNRPEITVVELINA